MRRVPSIASVAVKMLLRSLGAGQTAEQIEALRSASGIDEDVLEDPEGRIALSSWYGSLEGLAELRGVTEVALAPTLGFEQEMFEDVLGFLMLTAPTFGDALERMADYQRVLTDERFEIAPEDDGVRLRYSPWGAERPGHHIAALLVFADAVVNSRMLIGQRFAVDEVTLRGDEHPDPRFVEALGVPVRSGEEHYSMRLPRSSLDLPMPRSDPVLNGFFTREAHRRCEQLGDVDLGEGVVDEVRAVILRTLDDGAPSLTELADAVGVSSRTLQRRLRDAGISWRRLIDEVRLEYAQRWLSEGNTVSETASRLGFSEASAFYRAYRRWTGHTPGTR